MDQSEKPDNPDQFDSTLEKEKEIETSSDNVDETKPVTEQKNETSESIIEDKEVDETANRENQKIDFAKLERQIYEIEGEVREWRNKREDLNAKVIEKAKIRNQKNSEVRELINKANEDKKLRDQANSEIQELKKNKLPLQEEISILQSSLEKIDVELEKKDKEKEKEQITSKRVNEKKLLNVKRIQKEIRDLEWKLQTISGLTLEQERDIVDRIAILDEQMENLIEYREIGKEKSQIMKDLRIKRRQFRKTVNLMNKQVRESRIHHKSMIEGFNKANITRKEADGLHHDIQKIKAEADKVHSGYVNRIKTKRKMTSKIAKHKKLERKHQKQQELSISKEKTSTALQRTKDGKKISFDEFKNLIDRGLI